MNKKRFKFTAFDCAYITDQQEGKDYPFIEEKECIDDIIDLLNNQEEQIKRLEHYAHIIYMGSMFSTVKSFKGDVSKRYEYDEVNDNIMDTANHYGQYSKILGNREITMLLNLYNTLIEEKEEENE